MNVKNKNPNLLKVPSNVFDRQEFVFVGGISNITGAMSAYDLGSIRRIEKKIKREDFFTHYVQDLASLFQLNDGMISLLKLLLSDRKYYTLFRYNEVVRSEWSEALGLTAHTVELYFRSMVQKKKIIRKVRRGYYRISPDFFFHPHEVRNADFLSVHISYSFEGKVEQTVVQEKPKITLELINSMIEQFRKEQALEQQFNNLSTNPQDEKSEYKAVERQRGVEGEEV